MQGADGLLQVQSTDSDAQLSIERPTSMLLLLLLRTLDNAESPYVEATQQRHVHAGKGTSSSFTAFEADRCVL